MKQVSLRVVTGLVLTAILLTALAAYFAWASTPTTPAWIMSGIYAGAPSYTIWREGSNYFAKNENGHIDYSGTNATQIIDYATNQGGSTFLKGGIYLNIRNITLISNSQIYGEENTKLVLEATSNNIACFLAINKYNVTIRDLTIDCSSATGDSYGVIFQSTNQSVIEHIEVYGWSKYAIWQRYEGENNLYNNNILHDSEGMAILLGSTWYSTISDNLIYNIGGASTDNGIQLSQGDVSDSVSSCYNKIIGNTIRNCGEGFIVLYTNSEHNLISDNVCETTNSTTVGEGIQITQSDYNVVANNIVTFSATNAIMVDRSNYTILTGNQVYNVTNGYGQYVYGSHNVTVTGGLTRGADTNGLEVHTSTDILIANFVSSDCGSSGYYQVSSSRVTLSNCLFTENGGYGAAAETGGSYNIWIGINAYNNTGAAQILVLSPVTVQVHLSYNGTSWIS